MKRALNLLRSSLHYRRQAFSEGLQAAGYSVEAHVPNPGPGDVLLTWNLYGGSLEIATAWKARGATVLVAENGYLGKAFREGDWFALSRNYHGGAGDWNPQGPERWDSWEVKLQPWRVGGKEVLIFGQRGIGSPGLASPPNWAENIQRQYGGRIRVHPGKDEPAVPLIEDLVDVKRCITWSSAAALTALIQGVPVYGATPWWIGMPACKALSKWHDGHPIADDDLRLAMFRRLAWAQWELQEIRSGQAFQHLLS